MQPLILGATANPFIRTYPTGQGGEPRVLGEFTPYFKNTFDMTLKAVERVRSPNGYNAMPLITLSVKNKTCVLDVFGGRFGSGLKYKKEADFPKFDEAIAALAQVAIKYHEHRPEDWHALHTLSRAKEFDAANFKVNDVAAPFWKHVKDEPEKIGRILQVADADIQNHIQHQGFGPSGWLAQRSEEFLNEFRNNKSVRATTNAYIGTITESLFRGIPARYLMDMTLDFTEKMMPESYSNIMNYKKGINDGSSFIMINTKVPERKKQLVHSYYNKIC